jgi:hypothetical protein
MSSATRAASFPDIRVFMTPSSNSESHRHLGGSRWPTFHHTSFKPRERVAEM